MCACFERCAREWEVRGIRRRDGEEVEPWRASEQLIQIAGETRVGVSLGDYGAARGIARHDGAQVQARRDGDEWRVECRAAEPVADEADVQRLVGGGDGVHASLVRDGRRILVAGPGINQPTDGQHVRLVWFLRASHRLPCCRLQRAAASTHDQNPLLMTLVSYRVATTDDVPAMARLRDKSGWQGGASEERMRQYLAGTHHPQFARAGRAAYLAESSGAVAGFIVGHLTTRFACDAEVQWLLVAPAHRGGSVATPLLEQLTAWFLRQEAPRVCVNVSPQVFPRRAVDIQRSDIFRTSGRFGWDGGFGTSGYTDSAERVIGIPFTQRMLASPEPPRAFSDLWTMAYGAVE